MAYGYHRRGGACAYGASPGCPTCRQQRTLTGETGASRQADPCIGSGVPAHGMLSKAEDSREGCLDAGRQCLLGVSTVLPNGCGWCRLQLRSLATLSIQPDPPPTQPTTTTPPTASRRAGSPWTEGGIGTGCHFTIACPDTPRCTRQPSSPGWRLIGRSGSHPTPTRPDCLVCRGRMCAYAHFCLSAPPRDCTRTIL